MLQDPAGQPFLPPLLRGMVMGEKPDPEGMGDLTRGRILLVDDERGFVKGLKASLEGEGYQVTCAYDGQEAVDIFRRGQFQLVLLDVMLPGTDGFGVLRVIRSESEVPVIMLTAKGEDVDRIVGLEMGADDYVPKPFNTRELMARMKAVLRRAGAKSREEGDSLQAGDLLVDLGARRVEFRGREVELTPKEFEVLCALARSPGRVLTRNQLVEIVWGYEPVGDERVVDVHIRRLREKLGREDQGPSPIATKWGVGYYLRPDADRS